MSEEKNIYDDSKAMAAIKTLKDLNYTPEQVEQLMKLKVKFGSKLMGVFMDSCIVVPNDEVIVPYDFKNKKWRE
jgi:hypothetical protein